MSVRTNCSRCWVSGGPCRDRTYDQLIKRSSLAAAFKPFRTITYTHRVVLRIVDVPADKALNALLTRFFNSTAVTPLRLRYSVSSPH